MQATLLPVDATPVGRRSSTPDGIAALAGKIGQQGIRGRGWAILQTAQPSDHVGVRIDGMPGASVAIQKIEAAKSSCDDMSAEEIAGEMAAPRVGVRL